jgi:hypothetical protein
MGTSDLNFLLWFPLMLNQHPFFAMPTFTYNTSFRTGDIQQADMLFKDWFWFWAIVIRAF